MTARTLEYTGTLTVRSCWCGIRYAIPDELSREHDRLEGHTLYCPLGHAGIKAGESENGQLKRQLKAERDRAASLLAQRDQAEASLRTTKGHVTRLRKQVLAGACPLCGKRVYQLARHVARQHKGEPEEMP